MFFKIRSQFFESNGLTDKIKIWLPTVISFSRNSHSKHLATTTTNMNEELDINILETFNNETFSMRRQLTQKIEEGVHYLKKETQEVRGKEVVMDHKQALELVRSSHESTGHHGRNVMRLYHNGYHIYRLKDMIKLFKVCSSCEQYKRFCPDEIEFHPIISEYAFE